MKSIDPQYLIDPRFTSVTDQALSKDQVIDIYLHNFHGATSVSGGPYGSQIIGALAWNDDDIDFVQFLGWGQNGTANLNLGIRLIGVGPWTPNLVPN